MPGSSPRSARVAGKRSGRDDVHSPNRNGLCGKDRCSDSPSDEIFTDDRPPLSQTVRIRRIPELPPRTFCRAVSTDILHFPARVVVTPARTLPIVLEELSGVEAADDHAHADLGPSAAALRPPASEPRPAHGRRDHCHGSRGPSLDGTWVVSLGPAPTVVVKGVRIYVLWLAET